MRANAAVLGNMLQQQRLPLQTIYIVRHGDTKFNSDGTGERVRGWSDVPLTARGRDEAMQAARHLKGKPIVAIVASDLRRAAETAQILGKTLGFRPEFDGRLRTWNVGIYEGGHSKDVQDDIDAYTGHPDERIPGGESFREFLTRSFAGAADAAQKYQGRPVLLVTHHSVERGFAGWDAAGQPQDHTLDMKVYHEKGDKPGGIKVLKTSSAALRGMPDAEINAMGR